VAKQAPDFASQIRSVWSSDAETIRNPSGDHAQARTQSRCPCIVARQAPNFASQICSLWSEDADTIRNPSGDHAQLLTPI
jgi:hypothetical protein